MHTKTSPFVVSLRYALLTFLLIASAILVLLCTPGKVSAASATIVVHQSNGYLTIPKGQTGTLSVSCASGEQLLSGGFYDYAFEQAAFGVSSYPSAPDTWTVSVDNTGPGDDEITMYAYCLQADYSLGTTIVQAANPGSGLVTASCPTGSTLISGGYAGTKGVVTTSAPAGNGWQTDESTAYAICATQNVTATSLASAPFTTPANSTASGATATCPTGQWASGGGFGGPLTNSTPVYLSESGSGNTGWSVGAGGTGEQDTITVWAVCTAFPGMTPPPLTPTVTPTTPVVTPTTPTSPVQITYQVVSQWKGGFTAHIRICNIGSQPISGWTLQFTFPGDQRITQAWNGDVSQSGEQVTITNLSYNRLLEPGQCIDLGFNGTWTTSDASPTSFLLNGAPTS